MQKPRLNILVVDDINPFASAVADSLNRNGYFATFTDSGQKALEMLRTKKFDAILTDVRMPDFNGLDLLKEVKENLKIPVILFSGSQSEFTLLSPKEMGATAFLSKPFKKEDLLRLLKGIFGTVAANAA